MAVKTLCVCVSVNGIGWQWEVVAVYCTAVGLWNIRLYNVSQQRTVNDTSPACYFIGVCCILNFISISLCVCVCNILENRPLLLLGCLLGDRKSSQIGDYQGLYNKPAHATAAILDPGCWIDVILLSRTFSGPWLVFPWVFLMSKVT